MKYLKATLLLVLASNVSFAQEVAPLWEEYVDFKLGNRKEALLPDFSYAGYRFSEKDIPDHKDWKIFDVTDYGALPDDGGYDDQAIQKAIDAAHAYSGGAVIYFPAGQYRIAPDENREKYFAITRSKLIIRGAGKNETVIFQDKMRVGSRQFRFYPKDLKENKVATVIGKAARESFWITVKDPSNLREGMDVVLKHQSEAYTRKYFEGKELSPKWTRLFGPKGGMQIREIHTIAEIDGNRVRLANPLHIDVEELNGKGFELYSYPHLEECGIENIHFKGNWSSYPEEFVHHKDGIHDGGWAAISMSNLKNSWIRNCKFEDWNETINLRAGYQVSFLNLDIIGKKGHTSIHARSGYGVLIKNCAFNGAHHHGPGTGYGGVGTVVTQCSMERDQIIDSHSGQPYATLFDDINGGVFYNLGGPLPGLPHHGKHLVFWNFQYLSDRDFHYNFWSVDKRKNYTIADPIFVGFKSNTKITFENEGRDQLRGKDVYPKSLFEEQLKLRLESK